MVCKNSGIYGILGTLWVPITMAPPNGGIIGEYPAWTLAALVVA